jgi:hypothetical protein
MIQHCSPFILRAETIHNAEQEGREETMNPYSIVMRVKALQMLVSSDSSSVFFHDEYVAETGRLP